MEISTNVGTEALSAADQLRLEGKEEGREEGSMNKQKEIIQNMLLDRDLNLEKIAQYTGADLKLIQEVQKELGLA